MTLIEIILLALVSTVRPTSLAAVYALLCTESPRRLMIAYVIAGLVFTIAFGVLVIWAFNGIDLNAGTDRTKGIAEIIGGAARAAVRVRGAGRADRRGASRRRAEGDAAASTSCSTTG